MSFPIEQGPLFRASPVSQGELIQSRTLESFQDDLWRSLAGFADHVKEDDQRCYLKKCEAHAFFSGQGGWLEKNAPSFFFMARYAIHTIHMISRNHV